jgi:hypothetical protein
MRLRPIGWYYRELLEFNLMMDSLLNIFDDEDQRYKPTELTETFKTLNYYRTPDSGQSSPDDHRQWEASG